MNAVQALVALALLCPAGIRAQTGSPMECVSALRLPRYGALAREAKIAGKGSVHLQVGPDGRASNLKIVGLHPLLERELTIAAEEARFLEPCAGKSLVFEFTFSIEGEPSRDKGLAIRYEYPNHFVLTVHPPLPVMHVN
jgi:hypothetical protein